MRAFRFHVVSLAIAVASPAISWGADAKKEGDKLTPITISEIKRDAVDFQKDVLPILTRNCLACHNATTAENSLRLETPQLILKGGDNGPAAVAKKGAESLLLKVAAHQVEPVMPPVDNDVKAKALTPDELGLIKLWIDQGATGEVSNASTPVKWQPLAVTINPILAVAVSADGQYAACGRANQVTIYHVASGMVVAQLADPTIAATAGSPMASHLDLVQSLAFNPAGDLVASGGFREVKLWRRPADVKKFEIAAGDAVRAMTTSADNKLLAIGDAAGNIKLCDLSTGKETKTLKGHTAAVTGLVFSADGAKLYSSSTDKTVRGWNVADGAADGQITTPAEVKGLAITMATVANGPATQIVTAEADGTLRVWALPALPAPEKPAAALLELKGHSGPVNAVVTMAGGKFILSGGEDGSVQQWDVAAAKSSKKYNHGGKVLSLAIRADGKRFVSTGAETSQLWNPETTNKALAEMRGDFRARGELARLERTVARTKLRVADAKKSVTEAEDRAKKETDAVPKAIEAKAAAEKLAADKTEAAKKPAEAKVAAEKVLAAAEAELEPLTKKVAEAQAAAEKAADNKDLAKALADAKKAAADVEQKVTKAKTELMTATKPADTAAQEAKNAATALMAAVRSIDAAQASAKKATEAVPVAKASVEAFEAQLKKDEADFEAAKKSTAEFDKPTHAAAFSPDGTRVVTGGDNKIVYTWSAENGAPIDGYRGQGDVITSVGFASDKLVISGAANKTVVVWEMEPAWKLERTIGNIDDPTKLVDRVLALDFSPDGKLLATGSGEPSRSGEIKLWNVADGSLAKNIVDAHSDSVFSVRFSPAGDFIASSAADRFVKVFDLSTGKLAKSFEGHTHHVLGVAWKSDGKLLASGGADNSIKFWDIQTGDQRKTTSGGGKEVTSINFIGDSDKTLSSCGDKTLKVHNSGGGSERSLSGASDFVYASAVTPDGKLAIGGGQDSVLRVWSLETGLPTRTLEPAKPAEETK